MSNLNNKINLHLQITLQLILPVKLDFHQVSEHPSIARVLVRKLSEFLYLYGMDFPSFSSYKKDTISSIYLISDKDKDLQGTIYFDMNKMRIFRCSFKRFLNNRLGLIAIWTPMIKMSIINV